MTQEEACIALNLTRGIGSARAALLIETFGSPEAVFEADAQDIARVKGLNQETAEILLSNRGLPLEQELSRISRSGVKVFIKGQEGYPQCLADIEDAPLCLYVCGTLPEELGSRAVAIVGSRRATAYGLRMAQHFAESAVYSNWVVVSGLALGIDTAAHKGCVLTGGKTVAVLGGGLMKIQPAENIELARQILDKGGALVTEFPMCFAPTRFSFPMRNRIISAFSAGTLVVEAGTHSGALITAATALEQGKSVFAVPGNADSEMSMGCNDLIRSGNAAMAVNFEDILSGLEFLPGMNERSLFGDTEPNEEEEEERTSPALEDDPSVNESDRRILQFLRQNGDSGFDAISGGTGESASTLSRKLIALELSHRIRKNPDGTYRRIR